MWLCANACFDTRVSDRFFLQTLYLVNQPKKSGVTRFQHWSAEHRTEWDTEMKVQNCRQTQKKYRQAQAVPGSEMIGSTKFRKSEHGNKRERTGESWKGGGLPFSRHRPLLPYYALIFSLPFHLRALRAWNRLRKALMAQIGKTRKTD